MNPSLGFVSIEVLLQLIANIDIALRVHSTVVVRTMKILIYFKFPELSCSDFSTLFNMHAPLPNSNNA
jgi:hypothetical protein